MTELQDPEFFIPLELVSAAARRIDDNMNVALVLGKRVDSLNGSHVREILRDRRRNGECRFSNGLHRIILRGVSFISLLTNTLMGKA